MTAADTGAQPLRQPSGLGRTIRDLAPLIIVLLLLAAVEFLLAPPRITQRYWMPEVPRGYRRVSPAEVEVDTEDAGLVKDVEPA